LEPLQNEALRVIGELATVQGMTKKAMQETEEKLMTLTAQVVEEILGKEAEVTKEVHDSEGNPPKVHGGMEEATQQA
jgi:hypothetical protein